MPGTAMIPLSVPVITTGDCAAVRLVQLSLKIYFCTQVSPRDSAAVRLVQLSLKVPKREIFDRSDFPEFYTIKSSWVGDLLVKILTYYFNF